MARARACCGSRDTGRVDGRPQAWDAIDPDAACARLPLFVVLLDQRPGLVQQPPAVCAPGGDFLDPVVVHVLARLDPARALLVAQDGEGVAAFLGQLAVRLDRRIPALLP